MNAKSYLSLFLAGLLGLHAWQMSLIVLNYEYNQEVFVRLFCENQDRPELQCNGQCFLKENIDKAAQSESNKTHEIKLSWSPLCEAAKQHTAQKFSTITPQCYLPFQSNLFEVLISFGLLRPPQA